MWADSVTFDILTSIPFDKCDFKVITYEHDHYADPKSKYRELSRLFLNSKGYELVVRNIAPNDTACYEDWYVHPKYINPKIMEKMLDTSEDTKKASSYMLNENSMKVLRCSQNYRLFSLHFCQKMYKEKLRPPS